MDLQTQINIFVLWENREFSLHIDVILPITMYSVSSFKVRVSR